jgi:hypothetical protein
MSSTPKAKKQPKPLQAVPSRSGNPITTPPDTPTLPFGTVELAKQFIETVKLIHTSQSKDDTALYAGPQAGGSSQSLDARARASKLEYKTVDEVYVYSNLEVEPC